VVSGIKGRLMNNVVEAYGGPLEAKYDYRLLFVSFYKNYSNKEGS
jgi:hypothetical protein